MLDCGLRASPCFESQLTSGSGQRMGGLTCGFMRCRLALKAKASRQAAGERSLLRNAIFDQLLLTVVAKVIRNDLRLEYERVRTLVRSRDGAGTQPGTALGAQPGTEPGMQPRGELGAQPAGEPGSQPRTEPRTWQRATSLGYRHEQGVVTTCGQPA